MNELIRCIKTLVPDPNCCLECYVAYHRHRILEEIHGLGRGSYKFFVQKLRHLADVEEGMVVLNKSFIEGDL